jgi:hypothetical protein
MYVEKIFRKYDDDYFLNFLFAIYLLNFVFLARIKVFPGNSHESDYNWFVDVFFNFYKTVFSQSGQKLDLEIFEEIKDAHLKNMIINFIEQKDDFIYKSTFSIVEKKILQYVLPADILLKYLFVDTDIFAVIDSIVARVYDKDILDEKLESFRKGK